MWLIILSTEPGAFRLDERRWEDRKTILITAPKSVPVGTQQIPPNRLNCLAGRIKLTLKSAGIKNSPIRQAQNPRCRLLLSIPASGSRVSFKGRQVPVTSGQEVFEEVALGWLRGDPEFSCPLWVSLAAPRPPGQVSPRRGRLAARGRARVDARSASSRGRWLRSVGTRPASGPGRSSNFYLLTKPECFPHLEGQRPLLTHPAS